jgi:hypothetical protein
MRRERVLGVCLLAAGLAYAQQRGAQQREIGPQPPVVDPGGPGKPPSDAIGVARRRACEAAAVAAGTAVIKARGANDKINIA